MRYPFDFERLTIIRGSRPELFCKSAAKAARPAEILTIAFPGERVKGVLAPVMIRFGLRPDGTCSFRHLIQPKRPRQ